MIWIITTNSNLCRIYEFTQQSKTILLLKEINHPENRQKNSEYLTSDKPGHYKTDGAAGGAYAPHTDPKAVSVDHFAKEIADELNRGRNDQAYKKLILITPAHMNGLLLKHMDKHVKALIGTEIHKDVMPLSQHELQRYIQEKGV